MKKGGFGAKGMQKKAAAVEGSLRRPPDDTKKAERKEKDEVSVLKARLAKGHRLNDAELAQLELAAVARWNQLQREDDEEAERQRQAEAEKERQRELRLNK